MHSCLPAQQSAVDDGRPVFGGEGPRVCGCIICGGRGCVSVGLSALLPAWAPCPSELAPGHPLPLHQGSPHLGSSFLRASLFALSVFPGGRGNRSLLPFLISLVDPASMVWLDPSVFSRLTLSSQPCWLLLWTDGLLSVAWPRSRTLCLCHILDA